MTTDTLSKPAPVPITIKELNTENPRWCAGCGDFGIIMGLKRFIVDRQLVPCPNSECFGHRLFRPRAELF